MVLCEAICQWVRHFAVCMAFQSSICFFICPPLFYQSVSHHDEVFALVLIVDKPFTWTLLLMVRKVKFLYICWNKNLYHMVKIKQKNRPIDVTTQRQWYVMYLIWTDAKPLSQWQPSLLTHVCVIWFQLVSHKGPVAIIKTQLNVWGLFLLT